MINPVIFESSEETSVMEEGCLSIPGVRKRLNALLPSGIEYYNENGSS